MNATKATIYVSAAFGVTKIETTSIAIRRGSYAQYPSAVFITFRRPRERKDRILTLSTSPIFALVLDGWGHPDAELAYVPTETGASVSDQTRARAERTSHEIMSKYSCFDRRYQTEFTTFIDAYLGKSTAKVLADFRGVSTYEKLPTNTTESA